MERQLSQQEASGGRSLHPPESRKEEANPLGRGVLPACRGPCELDPRHMDIVGDLEGIVEDMQVAVLHILVGRVEDKGYRGQP